jgi:hypothetical protein
MRQTRSADHARGPLTAVLILATLALCAGSAAPLSGQPTPRDTAPAHMVLEQYLSHATLDPAMAGTAGTAARLGGAGARLLRPLHTEHAGGDMPIRDRLALGGFATYGRPNDGGLTTWHYGALADLRLLARPIAGRVDPLLSLGVGAFRTRREVDRPLGGQCSGTPVIADVCPPRALEHAVDVETAPAISPAVGVRVGLLPGLALRAETRDVIVYRGAPRHTMEFATGLSLARWRAPR